MKFVLNNKRVLQAAILCLAVPGLSGTAVAQKIFVGIPPLKYAAEKLSGREVGVVLKPGQNPHSFQPTARQISQISQAQVLFTTGVPFEIQLAERLAGSARDLKVITTDQNLPKRRFTSMEGSCTDHSHDHGDHGHSHSCGADAAEDPHVWLSPRLYLKQCEIMAEALSGLYPNDQKQIQERLDSLRSEIDAIHAELKQQLRPLRGEIIMVYHPAFGYFCDAYDMQQVAIEVAGKEPTPGQMAGIIRMAQQKKIHVIFVQKQFPAATARAVADAIDGVVVPLDPLAENILQGYRGLAASLSEALSQ